MFIYVKYEDGVKEAINADRIGNFDLEKIDFDKKYKIKWKDGNSYNGIIGKIQGKPIYGASKEEVEEKVESKRVEFSPLTLCDTVTDLETDSELERSRNLKSDANFKERIENKILNITSSGNKTEKTGHTFDENNAQRRDKKKCLNNKENKAIIRKESENSEKKKIEKLQKDNEYLYSQNMKLKKKVEDKDVIIADLMTLNINLQKKVISEFMEISKRNKQMETQVLNNFDELLHVVSEFFKKNPTHPQEEVGLPPVGYENKTRNEIHLGFNVYIPKSSYDTVLVISKSIPQFIKNLAVAVFGIKVLKESTVTGNISNRKKKYNNEKARPALDPTKLKAIRAIVKHYIITYRGLDEISVELELQQIGTHISHKICELNRTLKCTSIKNKQRMVLSHEVINTDSPEVQHVEDGSHCNQTSSEVSQTKDKEASNEGKEDSNEGKEDSDYFLETDSYNDSN